MALLAAPRIEISYADLKGNALGGPRANDPCNGIVQATLPGQRRPYMGDWASENFVRWAHSLGFIKYDAGNDTFSLASLGKQYIDAPAVNGINSILEDALLGYPPAVRVLRLLAQHTHLTKFEIGRQLGFVGENGFTSLPQDLLVRDLERELSQPVRTKMLSDSDGTSDKYARTIAGWLIKVGWIEQSAKIVNVTVAGRSYSYNIPQAYVLTRNGQDAFRRAEGRSRHSRTPKNMYFEMLATNAPSRSYLRVRRALTIQALNGRGYQTINQIETRLTDAGLTVTTAAIQDDLAGLENIGLQLEQNPAGAYRLLDSVQSFQVPPFTVEETQRGDIQKIKDDVRDRLTHIPHDRLVLIDLSYDSNQNRLFEQETISLLLECGYKASAKIGGANRPDGVAFTEGLAKDYGLIVDSKSYSNGFSCPAGQRREMMGYLLENINHPVNFPWWREYPAALTAPDDFRFLFVSSRFIGDFKQQFQRLSMDTQSSLGVGITAANLLLYAEAIKSGAVTLDDGAARFGTLDEVTF